MSDVVTKRPPPDGNDWPEIDDEIAQIAGILNAQHGRLVAVVERALANDEWQQAGVHTPAQWLAWKVGLSPHRAKEIVECARHRAAFPHVSEALDRGELAVDQVVAVMKAPAWADASVAEFAKNLTVAQLRTTITTQFFDEGPEPDPVERPRGVERLSTATDETGRWRINGTGDVDRGAIVDAALAEAKDALFERGHTDATWFDALVEISQRSLDSIVSPTRRDRFRIWLHIDVDSEIATLTDGRALPDSVRDHLVCDGAVQPVWEREGVAFNLGRTQRIVPERTRRVIERRDHGCRVPGCTNNRYVEIHHIVHWMRGGPTDTWNLLSLCGRHHRMHHRDQLGIAGNADQPNGVTFTGPHGRVITDCGRPEIPDQAPAPPASRYEHPDGGRMNYRYFMGWVHPDVLYARRTRHRH